METLPPGWVDDHGIGLGFAAVFGRTRTHPRAGSQARAVGQTRGCRNLDRPTADRGARELLRVMGFRRGDVTRKAIRSRARRGDGG